VRFGEVWMIGFFRLTPNPQRIGVKNLVAIRCPSASQTPLNLPGTRRAVEDYFRDASRQKFVSSYQERCRVGLPSWVRRA
jgi:hypothetical protein